MEDHPRNHDAHESEPGSIKYQQKHRMFIWKQDEHEERRQRQATVHYERRSHRESEE